MAHYRLHVKSGPKGTGASHAQYIERGGRFTAEKYGEIGEKESGNLPPWARGSAARFFAAADEYERANGNSYREFELALPVELSNAERGQLVREFVAEQIGDRHAYTWAIHEPRGHNPHAHIMFSERIRDGIERGPEQYFKRANTKHPERGGHLKSDWFTGKGGPAAVETLRARWAEVQNAALERAGFDVRVDHRSLKDQGIEREPGQHRGPAVSGIEARGEVAEVSVRRAAELTQRQQARQEVVVDIRQVTREEVAAERVAARERRELAREVTGEERALVLPLIEADRREQLGRAQAAAERRVERRQGLGIGELKEKLLTQARALRERIGREIGRVREWVRERFAEPLQRLHERSQEAARALAERVPGSLGRQPPSLAQLQREGREEWLAMRAQAQARGGELTAEQQRAQGRAAWKAQREMAVERTAQPGAAARAPASPEEAARERERLGSLSAGQLWELIDRIKPPAVEHLVELDPAVAGARRVVETHQFTALDALRAANRAVHENHWWRQEHGVQATLHDRGLLQAAYLVEREAAAEQATLARAAALQASTAAAAALAQARSEAERRITQETAPARAQVPELERLAAAAYGRETVVKEFERLARGRAVGREEYRDTSAGWQATPPQLRQMIERYNQEPPQVQEEILKRFATTPALAQSLEETLKLRREQMRDLDRDLER